MCLPIKHFVEDILSAWLGTGRKESKKKDNRNYKVTRHTRINSEKRQCVSPHRKMRCAIVDCPMHKKVSWKETMHIKICPRGTLHYY